MAKIVVLGVGEIADLAHYYFTNDTEHEVVAFTLDKEYIQDSTFKGLPIVDFEDVEKTYPPEDYQMFVAIGYKRVNKAREEKYSQAKGKGYSLESYISSLQHGGEIILLLHNGNGKNMIHTTADIPG